ncbi:MAG: alpha/beta hydrolase [Chloroflexi bacterium]|nr:alpha/beta hydrolase [Chloroflexota bacterium]
MEAQERRIELPGITLRVREWAAAGSPIVLVHGLASNSRIWDAVVPHLTPHHHVVALDQRGHGLSDRPTDGYAFARVVGDLHGVIGALGLQRPTLVGHSWGGNVVLQYAATHPQAVQGLVLVDGGFIELSAFPGRDWETVSVEMAPPDLTHFTLDELLERARTSRDYWNPAGEATLRTSFEVRPDGRIQPRLRREDHLEILRALWEQRPSTLYPRVTAPTLLVPARRSDATGRAAEMAPLRTQLVERAATTLPNGRLQWFEETVHDIPLQRPAELAQAILSVAGAS